MITTTHGDMDESLLTKREGVDEDDRAQAEWVEYWKDDELVHRSVHIALKRGIEWNLELGTFA
jgi:hypothetical protein